MAGRPKGIPKSGGRKKGSANKATAAKAAAVEASGLTPLDFLLNVMRGEAYEFSARIDAAKAAAPYIHPRLASVEHMGEGGGPIRASIKVSFVKP